MSVEENKAVIGRWMDVFRSGDIERARPLITRDYVAHQPGAPDPLDADGHIAFGRAFLAAFPDLEITTEDEVAEDDKVVTRWTMRGTHRGELMGIPPTGKRVELSGIEINRLVDGRIAEHWVLMDQVGLMQQLGVMPSPGRPG